MKVSLTACHTNKAGLIKKIRKLRIEKKTEERINKEIYSSTLFKI